MNKIISTLVLLFLAVINVNAQIASKDVDELVERTLKAFDVPGIAVGIVKDGKLIHAKGYGVRSLNTNEKVDENTLFGIASNSKAFTSAALAILVDEKKIKWDDKVTDYIPEFKMYNPYVTDEFTIRDLLTHRSGLGLGAGDLMIFPDSNDFTTKEIIYNIRYLKPVSSFRSKYDYDNLLYITAGEVILRVTGKTWEEFVETRILQPLDMSKSASTFNRLKDKSNVIDAHAPVNGKVKAIRRDFAEPFAAAAGIYSSVTDLSKWAILQMNNGKYGDDLSKQLFSKEMSKEMWAPQTILPVRSSAYNSHFAAYGLGWNLTDVKGYKQVSHTGGLAGIVTQFIMIPELKLGIIVLTNQQAGAAFTAISNTIKDSYLGMPAKDWVKQLSETKAGNEADAKKITDEIWNVVAEQQKSKVKVDVNNFIGLYKDNWLGEANIYLKNGKLWFTSKRSPRLTGEMVLYKGNTFVVKWVDRSMDADAFVKFDLDNNGKGSGIKMEAISFLTDFSFDFQDLDFKRVKE